MEKLTFAYFSMELFLSPEMPTYAGGLGILAGDTLKSAADLSIPTAGITLLHKKGYFRQHLDSYGSQHESPAVWEPSLLLEKMPARVQIMVSGRPVQVQAWRYEIRSKYGSTVPVYLLDTDLPENSEWDRSLTDHLYGGDARYRLSQETVLGFGGIAMLRALGYRDVHAYHINEGHSALITMALIEEYTWGRSLLALKNWEIETVSRHCVFTTHTPLSAGHDAFYMDLVKEVLGTERAAFLEKTSCTAGGMLNMSTLALCFSRYVNGVSMRHEEVTRGIFSNRQINAITNGVHAVTWTSDPFQKLFDDHIPQWRKDNLYLKYAIRIPLEEIQRSHAEAKAALFGKINQRTGLQFNQNVLTIGFARRAAEYKRHDLIFQDKERLRTIAKKFGGLQLIYGGKAHPRDEASKNLIKRVFSAAEELRGDVDIIYLEEYDAALARYICSGVDIWLNTPHKPQEASGTSGMKAALNGVPTFSIMDGWWIEGHIEGVTGWSIGDGYEFETNREREVASLYEKLENVICPLFYHNPLQFADVMRSAIAHNGSYFNTQRMVSQYLQNAYLSGDKSPA